MQDADVGSRYALIEDDKDALIISTQPHAVQLPLCPSKTPLPDRRCSQLTLEKSAETMCSRSQVLVVWC